MMPFRSTLAVVMITMGRVIDGTAGSSQWLEFDCSWGAEAERRPDQHQQHQAKAKGTLLSREYSEHRPSYICELGTQSRCISNVAHVQMRRVRWPEAIRLPMIYGLRGWSKLTPSARKICRNVQALGLYRRS